MPRTVQHGTLSVVPIYEFQADDGERIERSYPISKAPDVGRAITVRGKKYRRVLSLTPPVAHLDYDHDQYPKISKALPQFAEGAEHVKGGRHHGCAIIESRRHQDELCQKHGYVRNFDAGRDY